MPTGSSDWTIANASSAISRSIVYVRYNLAVVVECSLRVVKCRAGQKRYRAGVVQRPAIIKPAVVGQPAAVGQRAGTWHWRARLGPPLGDVQRAVVD